MIGHCAGDGNARSTDYHVLGRFGVEEKEQAAAEKCEGYRQMGYHCSESCIRACAEILGLKLPEEVLRIASAFRGGGGGYGDRCGMVEAGMMLIAYRYGRIDPKVDVSDYSYLIRILHDRFLRELGSFDCRVLKPFAYHLSGEAQNCSYTYKKGAGIVMKLLLEADQLMKEMPESERYQNRKGLQK
jgi:C_GCAxxG_C_C family probable redox protein